MFCSGKWQLSPYWRPRQHQFMVLFWTTFDLFILQSHSFDGTQAVGPGLSGQSEMFPIRQLHLMQEFVTQNIFLKIFLLKHRNTQVSHDVEGRQKDLLNPSQRESLGQHLEQIKTLAPILICSMKIFIQILNQASKAKLCHSPPFSSFFCWSKLPVGESFMFAGIQPVMMIWACCRRARVQMRQ